MEFFSNYEPEPTENQEVQRSNPHELPSLATKETVRLRETYPSIEYLEAGKVASWLVERQDQLLIRAREERTGMNLSKLLTLAGSAVGAICYATSPLAPIGALIAGVGYVWAVAEDLNTSHQFAPIPFIRGNFVEFLAAMGDSGARDEWFSNRNEMVDLMNHLEPIERYEFVMLRQYTSTLTEFLTSIESGKRFYGYRWLLDCFINFKGAFPTPEQLTQHMAKVAPDPRINYQHVEILQRQTASVNVSEIAPVKLIEIAAAPVISDTLPKLAEDQPNLPVPGVEQITNPTEIQPVGDNPVLINGNSGEVTMDTLTTKGNKFVDTLTNTTLSCIFLGIPGTGKTTILGVAIGRMRIKYGNNFTVEMVAMKGDSLLNVRPIVFYRHPGGAFDAIYRALLEHRRRAGMPKEKRLEYAKIHPYRLIIDDYTSQQQKLDGIFKDFLVEYGIDKDGNPLEIKLPLALEDALNELWFNGRETNVGIWVGTHSEIVDDLRFVSSKSGRSSGLLCFMGRRDKNTNQGHYDIVSGNLKTLIISDKQQLEILKKQFPQAMQLAYEKDKPLALISGIDNGAFGFAIIPDLTREYQTYFSGVAPGEGEDEKDDDSENEPCFISSPSSPSPQEKLLEPLSRVSDQSEEISEERDFFKTYTPSNITRPHLTHLINTLKNAGMGQEQIIVSLWQVSKGGGKNSRWQKAREEYRAVMRE